MSKSLTQKKVVEDYIQYYNSFEIDKMLDLFLENCIFENVSNSSGSFQCIGKQALRDLAFKSKSLFKSRKQTVTNWILGDNKIAVEIKYEAILASDLPNGLKAGSSLSLKGISIFEFQDGKIHKLVDFS